MGILLSANDCDENLNFEVDSSKIGNSKSSNSNLPSSEPIEEVKLYKPNLMDESNPYVLSELILTLDSPIIGTVDNTLSFPVYHDKYGSYVLAKRTEKSYIVRDKEIVYMGVEMEDGLIRYFPSIIIEDAYYGLRPYENISVDNQPFEKLYFNGAMTEMTENNTLTYLLSMTDGHPDKTNYSFYDTHFGVLTSYNDLMFHSEDEILDYLLTIEYFYECHKIISYFGKRSLYNPSKDTYTFISENGPESKVYLKEIYNWNIDEQLSHKDVCIKNFIFDTATKSFSTLN